VLALTAAACGDAPGANKGGPAVKTQATSLTGVSTPAAPRPLDHWDEFKFGMSFDDAIAAKPGIEWDGDSFKQCRDEMPVKGCTLWPDYDHSYAPSFAGMALLPNLEFNEAGQLTDVDLLRTFKAAVTASKCEAIHGRLVDALYDKVGPSSFRPQKGALVRRSPGGHEYFRSNSDDVMVAEAEFRKATDGSMITLLTTFTAGSQYTNAECRPGIYIQGPKALPRRPINTPN